MQEAAQLSDVKRNLLSRFLRGVGPRGAERLRRRPAGSIAPLSLTQAELYHREQRVPGIPPLYNECVTLRMLGPLNLVALEKSFNEIVQRHELWRTTIETKAGQPVQIVHPTMPMRFPLVDLEELPEAERESEALRLVGEDVRRPFDLSRELLRPKLVRLNRSEHRLFLTAHQMVLDGVSAYQIFPSELATFYQGFLSGKSVSLPELPVQYADFACWQREWLSGAGAGQIDYWRKQLAGEPQLHSWPFNLRPVERRFRGRIQKFSFPKALSDRIKQFARRSATTVFLVLLTGLATLLHRYTSQEKVLLGTLSPSGRKRSEVMGLLGYFLNPVTLKLSVEQGMTFRELLSQAQQVLLEAICHDDVPIECVARELNVGDDSSPSPFFSTAISLQPPTPNLDLPWSVTTMDVESGGSPWDLYFAFIDRPEGLIGRAQFNSDLLDTATVERALQDLQEILGSASLEAVA